MARRVATVIGGSGFIGRRVVQRLAAEGFIVRAAVRDVVKAEFLRPMGDVGQVRPFHCNVTKDESVAKAVEGADVVVSLVGILYQKGKRSFQAMHVEAAERVAKACAEAGVPRLVHMSALGANGDAKAEYARTKAEGERKVAAAFPAATIVRPSVVFGPEDGFFNTFAAMARISPILPVFTGDGPTLVKGENGLPEVSLFGSGGPKFQPVYVGDVAEAIFLAATSGAYQGKTYEFGGPRAVTFKEVMEIVMEQTERSKLLLPVPLWAAKIKAFFLELLPVPPLTRDQVTLLERDNVLTGDFEGLEAFGLEPQTMEAILPQYMARYKQRHRHLIMRDNAGA